MFSLCSHIPIPPLSLFHLSHLFSTVSPRVKIVLMGGGRQEKPPPTTSKNPFLPSKVSKIKKKHVAKGAEKLPEPEPEAKNLFEGMDFGDMDLLDEHDDDHDVAAEFQSHQGELVSVSLSLFLFLMSCRFFIF